METPQPLCTMTTASELDLSDKSRGAARANHSLKGGSWELSAIMQAAGQGPHQSGHSPTVPERAGRAQERQLGPAESPDRQTGVWRRGSSEVRLGSQPVGRGPGQQGP